MEPVSQALWAAVRTSVPFAHAKWPGLFDYPSLPLPAFWPRFICQNHCPRKLSLGV